MKVALEEGEWKFGDYKEDAHEDSDDVTYAIEEKVAVDDEGLDEHRDCGGNAGEKRYDVETTDDVENNIAGTRKLSFESHSDWFGRTW